MERWQGRVALVTGAAGGIGSAICRQLVEAGMIVVGIDLKTNKIEAMAKELKGKKGNLVGVACDLTKDSDVEYVFAFMKETYKGVDVCVNVAGISYKRNLLEGNTEEWREMLDVNVVALCLCTKLAVKSMQERGVDDGHIVHIGSMSGHQMFDYPPIHFYMSTKFAVRALTEGIRQELRELKSNIRISSISPGTVHTNLAVSLSDASQKELSETRALKPEDIANSVWHMISAPPHVQIHDLIIRPTCDPFH